MSIGSLNQSILSQQEGYQQLAEKQLQAFLKRGFPTSREEQWKYTDTTALARYLELSPCNNQEESLAIKSWHDKVIRMTFINGHFSAAHSDLKILPETVVLCSIKQAIKNGNDSFQLNKIECDAERYPFASLNTALMTDGMFLFIPDNLALNFPIHCVFVNTVKNLANTRNFISVGKNSKATILEEHVGTKDSDYFANIVTTLDAGENAQIHYHKIQDESLQGTHIANTFIMQKQNSLVKSFCLAKGSILGREDVTVNLNEENAECHLNGFYTLAADKQHIDNHLHVNHSAAHGKSTMVYKGILDKKSKAVFNGKVLVQKDAQHNSAHQANHNILLSNTSEINTKPELEIYADDVKCTHGATVGQLDSDSLFYLRSRGIGDAEAMQMLTKAFATDVFSKIENALIRDYMQARAGYANE